MATRKKKSTQIAGTALVPNLDDQRRPVGVETTYFYWVGLIASCPVEHVDIAGINFPKSNEDLEPDRMNSNKKVRIPRWGAIVLLTEDKIRRFTERLPRTVVRIYDDERPDPQGQQNERGTGQNVKRSGAPADPHVRPRRGQLITIPSQADIDERLKHKRSIQAYRPDPKDRPIADFMYAQLCSNQESGSRDMNGDALPDVLSVTGLSWPDVIDDDFASIL